MNSKENVVGNEMDQSNVNDESFKKEIKVNRGYLKTFFIAIIIGFIIQFSIEHKSEIKSAQWEAGQFIQDDPNSNSLVVYGKYKDKDGPGSFTYKPLIETPFNGNHRVTVTVYGNNSYERSLDYYLKFYVNRAMLYLKATFCECQYFLLFGLIVVSIRMFLNKFKLKLN